MPEVFQMGNWARRLKTEGLGDTKISSRNKQLMNMTVCNGQARTQFTTVGTHCYKPVSFLQAAEVAIHSVRCRTDPGVQIMS